MTKATEQNTTPAPATPPPEPLGTWARLLAPSFERDDTWNGREPISKALCATSGAADRIGGLAEICWSLSLSEMEQGGQWAGEAGLRHPYGFIARTLSDVARGLREAEKLYRAEMDKQDAAALRASKRARK